jgi:large subunit ribosomal protein L30
MLRIKQTRSPIGTRQHHRATLRTLGLRKIGQTVEKADSGSVRGMLRSVAHLISFEEIADAPPAKAAKPTKKAAASKAKPKVKTAAAKSTTTKKATTKAKSSTAKKTTTRAIATTTRSRAKKSE